MLTKDSYADFLISSCFLLTSYKNLSLKKKMNWDFNIANSLAHLLKYSKSKGEVHKGILSIVKLDS